MRDFNNIARNKLSQISNINLGNIISLLEVENGDYGVYVRCEKEGRYGEAFSYVNVNIPEIGECNTIDQCTIRDVKWYDLGNQEIPNAFEGDNIKLRAGFDNCECLDVRFNIRENDGVGRKQDVGITTLNGKVSNDVAEAGWVVGYHPDDFGLDSNPEYVFKANILNSDKESSWSNELNVEKPLIIFTDDSIRNNERITPDNDTWKIEANIIKTRRNVDFEFTYNARSYFFSMSNLGSRKYSVNKDGFLGALTRSRMLVSELPLGSYTYRIVAYDDDARTGEMTLLRTFSIVEETCEWECTDFSPAVCPAGGQQTRICTDSNNCGIIKDKPDEIKICTIVTSCDDSSDCPACATNPYCEEVLGSGKHLCTPSRIKQSCISESCSADSCPTSGFSTDYCYTVPDPLCLSDIDNDRVADNLDCNDASTAIGQCDGTQCKQCNQVASASNNRGICINIPGCVVPVNCADTALDVNQNTCTTAGCKWSGDTSKCDSNCQNNLVDNNEDGICEVPANTLDQCRIINPRWTNVVDGSIDLAYDDDPVKLKVDALNCQGLDVNFQIAENDGGLGVVRSDSNVNIPLIRNIEIINDVAEAEWEAQYINDVIGNPEYVFKAIVSDGTNTKESTWSSNLNVGVAEISFTTNSIKNEEMITQDNTTWKVEVRPSRERDNVVFVFENNNDLRIS